MGLDFVEIILELEDRFAISIPDGDAEKLTTIGSITGYIVGRLEHTSSDTCATSHKFYEFRHKLMTLLPLTRKDIRPGRRLEELVPRNKRRRLWRELKQAGVILPRLRLARATFGTALIGVFVAATCAAWIFGASSWLLWLPAFGGMAACVTRPWATHLSHSMVTVGDAVFLLTGPKSMVEGRLNEAEIGRTVRLVVADQCGASVEELKDETHVLRDLHLG